MDKAKENYNRIVREFKLTNITILNEEEGMMECTAVDPVLEKEYGIYAALNLKIYSDVVRPVFYLDDVLYQLNDVDYSDKGVEFYKLYGAVEELCKKRSYNVADRYLNPLTNHTCLSFDYYGDMDGDAVTQYKKLVRCFVDDAMLKTKILQLVKCYYYPLFYYK